MENFSALLMGTGAAGTGSSQGSILPTLFTFGALILIFYFLIIRPQSKKQKETRRMLSALKRNDVVSTIGGIHGTIHALKEHTVILRVGGDTKMEFSRSAIANVIQNEATSEPQSKTTASEKPPANPVKKRSRKKDSDSKS